MRLFLKFGLALLLSIVLALYLSGCVDVDSPNITPVDQRSTTRFINLSSTLGTMSVNVDGNVVASTGYALASNYLSIASGTRTFIFSYNNAADTLVTALSHDMKYSVYCVYDPLNGDRVRTYSFASERRTYAGTQAFVPQAALVRFINLSNDTTAASVTFALTDTVAATADSVQSDIAYGGSTPYIRANIVNQPQFTVYNQYHDVLAAPTTLAEGRFSVVLFGNKLGSTLEVKVYKED
jgi:hypothetical protein